LGRLITTCGKARPDSLVGLAASQFNARKNNAYREYFVKEIPYSERNINADSVFREAI
jgi:hypothetical protein